MKRLSIILLTLALAAGMAQAKNWCESLIENLNRYSDVDKTIAVNRAPGSQEITNATYDFRFSSNKLYKQIFNTLKKHSPESDYYSESGSKNKTVIMRFTDKGRRWSCKLESDSRNKQFLITVKSGDSGVEYVISAEEIEAMRQQAMQASEEGRKAAAKAREDAAKAREEAEKLRQMAKERRQASKARSRSGSSSTVIITTENSDQKAVIENHSRELRQAEAERKRKLGL